MLRGVIVFTISRPRLREEVKPQSNIKGKNYFPGKVTGK